MGTSCQRHPLPFCAIGVFSVFRFIGGGTAIDAVAYTLIFHVFFVQVITFDTA